MTAEAWVFCLLAYGVVITVLFVVVLGTVDEQRAELDRLRRRIHPSTRNRKAYR